MNALNSVLIEGFLTADPMVSHTSEGVQVCTFSIACVRFHGSHDKVEKEVSFLDIETWSRLAEACGEALSKGRGVRVVGRLKEDRWEADGTTHSRIKIVAEHIEFKPQSAATNVPDDESSDERETDR